MFSYLVLLCWKQHWDENIDILIKFCPWLAAPEVIKMKTSSSPSHDNLTRMIAFPFKQMPILKPQVIHKYIADLPKDICT